MARDRQWHIRQRISTGITASVHQAAGFLVRGELHEPCGLELVMPWML
jgi:hypothetical protein